MLNISLEEGVVALSAAFSVEVTKIVIQYIQQQKKKSKKNNVESKQNSRENHI